MTRYKRICVETGCSLPRPPAKLIFLSCLVAVFGYFTYKELQVNRSVWPRKFIYQPRGLMCSRKCSTILNFTLQSIHYGTSQFWFLHQIIWVFFSRILFHNREVSFVYYLPNLVLISLILLMPYGFQKPRRCRCKFSLLLSLVRVRQKNKILVTRIWNAWLHMKNFCG